MLKDRIILPSYDRPFDDGGAFSYEQNHREEEICERCLEPESECMCDIYDAEEKEDIFKTLGEITKPQPVKKDNPLQSFVNKLNKSF